MKGYIYKITNSADGKVYLGSTTKSPQERFSQHLYDLKRHCHHNAYLQHAYDKYGAEVFSMASKEYDLESEHELRLLEERYINFCWNSGRLYNLSKRGTGGDLLSYHPNNQEIRKKLSEAAKHMHSLLSEEERERRSNRLKGELNPNYGNRWNEEQRNHLSEVRKEYYETHECPLKGKKLEEIVGEEKAKELKELYSQRGKKMTGDKNSFYGKHHSEETKQKIREKNFGKKNPTSAKPIIANGVVYESASACAKELNMPLVTVAYRARKGIYGFVYVGENEQGSTNNAI